MEFYNSNDRGFFNAGLNIIRENGELLVFIRYHAMAGMKNYYIIRNENELVELLATREKRESLIFFKEFQVFIRGLCSQELRAKIAATLTKPFETDWVVIIENGKWHETTRYLAEDVSELLETLEDEDGLTVTIIDEPDWLNDGLLHHAYVPDEDGVVRPGIY